MIGKFELDSAFIRAEGLRVSPSDLLFGLRHGYMKPNTAIDLATREVADGSTDPTLVALACLFHNESESVLPRLESQLGSRGAGDSELSKRKWLYLQLKAAYLERDHLKHPWDVVAIIFDDFGFPSNVAPFVPWMPLRPGDEPGLPAMLCRWERYLEEEHRELANHCP